jgi:predicted GIY-YIG superfamily endonuclease
MTDEYGFYKHVLYIINEIKKAANIKHVFISAEYWSHFGNHKISISVDIDHNLPNAFFNIEALKVDTIHESRNVISSLKALIKTVDKCINITDKNHVINYCCICGRVDIDPNRLCPRCKDILNAMYEKDLGERVLQQMTLSTCTEDTCYVYLIKEDNGTAVKIGVSKHPEKRITALNTSNKLSLIHTQKYESRTDALTVERKLHKKYEELRVKKEWFNLNENHISCIKEELLSMVKECENELLKETHDGEEDQT